MSQKIIQLYMALHGVGALREIAALSKSLNRPFWSMHKLRRAHHVALIDQPKAVRPISRIFRLMHRSSKPLIFALTFE